MVALHLVPFRDELREVLKWWCDTCQSSVSRRPCGSCSAARGCGLKLVGAERDVDALQDDKSSFSFPRRVEHVTVSSLLVWGRLWTRTMKLVPLCNQARITSYTVMSSMGNSCSLCKISFFLTDTDISAWNNDDTVIRDMVRRLWVSLCIRAATMNRLLF